MQFCFGAAIVPALVSLLCEIALEYEQAHCAREKINETRIMRGPQFRNRRVTPEEKRWCFDSAHPGDHTTACSLQQKQTQKRLEYGFMNILIFRGCGVYVGGGGIFGSCSRHTSLLRFCAAETTDSYGGGGPETTDQRMILHWDSPNIATFF